MPNLLRAPCAPFACTLALAAPALAQELRVFPLDAAQPATVHWSATSNLGPLGAFLQSYSFRGDVVVDFDASPATGRARITGARLCVPNSVVAALMGGPSPAVVSFHDLELNATSPDFDITPGLPGGTFSTTLDLSARSGFMQVEPPFGPAFLVDLAGASLGSAPVAGSFPAIGPLQRMTLGAFSFDMPFSAAGWSGAFTHDVTRIVGIGGCAVPEAYCPSDPSSPGGGTELTATGSTSVLADDLRLEVRHAPTQSFGVFFYGLRGDRAASGQGTVCVGGPLQRLGVVQADVNGAAGFDLPLASLQTGPLALTPGAHAYFQFYHRVPSPIGGVWNFSNGLAVTLCP